MRLSLQTVKRALSGVVLFVFLLPMISFADAELSGELGDLENLIRKVNNNQSNIEKLGKFEEKLVEFFYDASPSAIKKLLAEFTPGDTLTLVVFMKYSGKTAVEVSELRRDGLGWDKMSEKLEVSLERVIRYIKKFRALAC